MDMLNQYQEVADRFISQIAAHPDVEGVMHLGGLARGKADEYSDIDVAVFSEKKLEWLKTGEQETDEGFDLEVFNVKMEDGFDDWDEIAKEAYQEGKIAFDRTGKVQQFIREALFYSDEYRTKRTAELIFAIAWHGWTYTPFKWKTAKNYRWILPEKLWFIRNNPQNAFYTAHYCVDKYLELLYAINKQWIPDYKWRYIRAKQLPWLPSDFSSSIDILLFGAWTEKTWETKSLLFQKILDEAIEKAIDYMPEDWYSLL